MTIEKEDFHYIKEDKLIPILQIV